MNDRFFEARTFSVRLCAGLLLWAGCTVSHDEEQEEAAATTAAPAATAAPAPTAVACLRTEFFPIAEEDGLMQNRLARELGRQAVLIAARDGLGLPTRDKTLQEPFPAAVTRSATDLRLKLRAYNDGTLRLSLAGGASDPAAAPWEHEAKFTANCVDAYPTLLGVLEPLSRGELVEALRSMGFDGEVLPPNEENQPPESVTGLLGEMNFVSQYAAVRAAHAAIAEKGPSVAWLGVLARGYANLALMTQHHWWSGQEAFAARALLYAERMIHLAGANDVVAHAHRAYVEALVGMHAVALDELKEIDSLQGGGKQQAALPGWLASVGPYCRFERQALSAAAGQDRDLAELAQRLEFEQCHVFGDDRWMYQSARKSMQICPEAYGVYAALAEQGPLRVKRMAAYYGPAALGNLLPARLATLPDLPHAIRAATDPEWRDEVGERADPDPDDPFSVAIPRLARALEAETKQGVDAGEPSWAALGKLIDEEQFVQAANYMNVATDATESSLAGPVAGILPLIKDHRYAPYVESYSVNMYEEVARYYEILGDMQFLDPRGNMQPMLFRAWKAYDKDGKPRRGERASRLAFFGHNFTLLGICDPILRLERKWWDGISTEQQKMLIDEFGKISPHAPQVLRMAIHGAKNPSPQQLAAWEEQAGEDPVAYTKLGYWYRRLEQYDDAIRCYERAIELSPRLDAFTGLADSYRGAGKEELWVPTLERYFEVEDLGLGHAQIHYTIAEDLIAKGKWEEAEPHALEAARTWSGWGLKVAAFVDEGLGRWEKSERWIREMSTSYPTSSGEKWYFWCRRTGRGRLQEARPLAESYFKVRGSEEEPDAMLRALTFSILEDRTQQALDQAKKLVQTPNQHGVGCDNRAYYRLHLATLAHEIGEAEVESDAIAEIRRLADEGLREEYPDYCEITLSTCSILEGDLPSEEAWAELDKRMETPDARNRCICEYFIGRALDLRGETELSDVHWRRVVTRGPFEQVEATLAGYYLSKRHGTSRP